MFFGKFLGFFFYTRSFHPISTPARSPPALFSSRGDPAPPPKLFPSKIPCKIPRLQTLWVLVQHPACTIHQPSPQMFSAFGNLLLLGSPQQGETPPPPGKCHLTVRDFIFGLYQAKYENCLNALEGEVVRVLGSDSPYVGRGTRDDLTANSERDQPSLCRCGLA